MDVEEYLKRIGFTSPVAATIDTLRGLHRAHLLTVPFENLDIHLGRPILLSEESFLNKIVRNRRGGFCYELNGLFAALLRAIEFNVTLLSARVIDKDGQPGPEYDHLTLLIQLDGRWLADVGFGDSFLEPLSFDNAGAQWRDGSAYRLTTEGSDWAMQRLHSGEWKTQYLFTLQPRELSEFSEMCRYHQTSPDSPFTRGRICSRATPDGGRITLSDMRLVITKGGERSESHLGGDEYDDALREHFGINLSQ